MYDPLFDHPPVATSPLPVLLQTDLLLLISRRFRPHGPPTAEQDQAMQTLKGLIAPYFTPYGLDHADDSR